MKNNFGLDNLRLKAKAYIRKNPFLMSSLGKTALRNKMSLIFPTSLYIEPTNNCNLDCVICPRKLSSRQIGHMDFELYKKIIDESLQYGQRDVITFHKDGEPLLHPELKQMIAYAKEKKAARTLRLSTNALLLDEARCREVILSGLDAITISIDGATEKTYKSIRGGDFNRVVNNATRLINIRNGMGKTRPWVIIQIIKVADTLEQIESFKKRWKSVADEVTVKEFLNWGGSIALEEDKLPNLDLRQPCPDLWTYLTINWDGRVSICCLDFDCQCIVGDANKQSLKEIWDGKDINQYRLSHLDHLWQGMPMCNDCNVWYNQLPLWSKGMEKKYRQQALRALNK